MRLKIGKPKKMWAIMADDPDEIATDCEGTALYWYKRDTNAAVGGPDTHVERVLVLVTRPGGSTLNNAGLLDCYTACKEFVRKCESGEARSKRSYAAMKAAIAKSESVTRAEKPKRGKRDA